MQMTDNISQVWNSFFQQRTVNLFNRFDGQYRAIVVETNDPLQMYRVRFKCPELHDFNLKPEECPFAVPAFALGGKNAGSWEAAMIGDTIWISFEKAHTYGPIWTGFAPGTRRKRYPLEQIYTKSPLAVDADGKPKDKPQDFDVDYLPKDFRPMSTGWRDRYGNSEINSFVGFFPIEHKEKPAPTGADGVSRSQFNVGDKPKVNEPDRKYMGKLSKYGNYSICSDVGYFWNKDNDFGEFKGIGDPLDDGGEEERTFEVDRYKYFLKLLNENEPNSIKDNNGKSDQRRFEIRTRAGHKFEMRDVGWSQKDGGLCGSVKKQNVKSRVEDGKYGGQILSKWEKSDERWMKFRTKGGHLIQMMDMGFNPEDDNFYKRKLIEECGSKPDLEDDAEWTKRDARQMRFVTRYGFKFVLDDRGTHTQKAEEEHQPHGNGLLLKGRRQAEADPDKGTPRGFGIEFNEKDELNTTRWYSPKSKLVELNDRKDYALVCTDMNGFISEEWKGLKENEFAKSIGMSFDPEKDTYHLKLDKHNGYIRLKTSAGNDNSRNSTNGEKFDKGDCWPEQNATEKEMEKVDPVGLNQGLECRDGIRGGGEDGAWAELVDCDHRGIWFTRKNQMGIWRSRMGKDQFLMIMDKDGDEKIVIRHNEDGPIQIYCKQDVQIKAERDITLQAGRDISLKADRDIIFEAQRQLTGKSGTTIDLDASGGQWQLAPDHTIQNVQDNAPQHTGFLPGAFPGPGAQSDTGGPSNPLDGKPLTPLDQNPREPVDRGHTDNEPFDAVPDKVITAKE